MESLSTISITQSSESIALLTGNQGTNLLPPIYCINLKSCSDRRQRMEHRFGHHHLNVTFIDAVNRDCSLVDYYGENIITFENSTDKENDKEVLELKRQKRGEV